MSGTRENQDEEIPRQGDAAPIAPIAQPPRMNQLDMEAMMAEITRRLETTFANRANQANEFFYGVDPLVGSPGRGVRAQAGGVHLTHHRRPRAEEHLSQSKLRIPSFYGRIDPDAYLEWETEMELVFNCHYYTEAKKVKLAASGFSGHAIHWWDQIVSTRRRNREPQITSWFEMKIVMKKRFAPDYNQFGYVQDRSRQNRSQERPSSRPSSTKWTRQEHLCSKEKLVFQQSETNHSSPICKGKKENLNLRDFSNESSMCNYRKQIPRRLFVENSENNNEEKNEVSETSSSPNEATISRRLFETEKFSNDPITGKCFLPSSQTDPMLKGKEICRELTICEPVSPSSLVFSTQDFEKDTPEEVPKKVPPARNMEPSSHARDVVKARGGEERPDPVQNSSKHHEESPLKKTTRRSPVDRSLAIETNLAPAQISHSILGDSRLKLCKDIGVPSSLPNLFMLVTPDEEKQFGLENVKELCVSGIIFDKMIQSLEAPKYETSSRSECSLNAETLDFMFALSHKLTRRTLVQKSNGIDADLMIGECFSNKMLHNLKSVRKGCETLCYEDFWVLKPCDMNSVLRKNVFGSFSKLEHDFAWSELVLPKSTFDFALLELWFRNMNFTFNVLHPKKPSIWFFCTFDVVFLVFSKGQDKQVMDSVPTARMIQGLDKQVDYGPKKHLSREWYQNRASTGRPQQSYQFGDWIWDPTLQPLLTIQVEHIFDHTSNDFNLFFCVADELDLRSNPFKGGGDGVILERVEEDAQQLSHEEEQHEQMKQDQGKENVDQKEDTAQEEREANTAQEKEVQNVLKGFLIWSRAKTQRKPILQVAWAWLRRKRKKPRRVNQMGLFNCCIYCKLDQVNQLN